MDNEEIHPATAGATPSARVDSAARVAHASASLPGELHGKNSVADGVVSKVAGIAAREVPGVFALGGGGARALGAIRGAVGQDDLSQGIRVEVGETQVAIDITIVVEYPSPIQQVANAVRAQVTDAVSGMVGLEVVEVNVAVNDVHLPAEENDAQTEARVS